MKKKKKSMTREEAAELYQDLRKTMATLKTTGGAPAGGVGDDSGVAKQIAAAISEGLASEGASSSTPPSKRSMESSHISSILSGTGLTRAGYLKGEFAAIGLVLMFASCKLVFSVLELSGILSVESAQASLHHGTRMSMHAMDQEPKFSKEEIQILTSLDSRRAELEERGRKLDERQIELEHRDKEFAVKLTELRELTERLREGRESTERRKDGKLEQLSNVYGSMNPKEAAALIEQLDVPIALRLLQRMPEKRIGQILSLMSPERALTITKMLTGGKE